jgi:NAD+ synthase
MKSIREALKIDAAAVSAEIGEMIRGFLRDVRRKGAVIGLSGGVDSSVVAALCVRAIGKERVMGLFMPEADSSPESLELGQVMAASLGIETKIEDLTGLLSAAGCYLRRDNAIRTVIPEFGDGYKCKIVLPDALEGSAYQLFSLVVRSPTGNTTKIRLPLDAYLAIVAATNFKQRSRKMMEYYYADRLNYAVAGTPNLLEYDQGFFVKNGDGAADFKPIAHLYKSQVYALAEFLGVPDDIRRRPPTTDTYSMDQSQEEFYFALPFDKMDLALFARSHDLPPEQLARELEITSAQAERIYSLIDSKRKAAHYLLSGPKMIKLA